MIGFVCSWEMKTFAQKINWVEENICTPRSEAEERILKNNFFICVTKFSFFAAAHANLMKMKQDRNVQTILPNLC